MFPNQDLSSEIVNDQLTNEFYLKIWKNTDEIKLKMKQEK